MPISFVLIWNLRKKIKTQVLPPVLSVLYHPLTFELFWPLTSYSKCAPKLVWFWHSVTFDPLRYLIFSGNDCLFHWISAISRDERQKSLKKYEVEKQRVKDSVAFWRRADENITIDAQPLTAASVSCLRSNPPCKCTWIFMMELFDWFRRSIVDNTKVLGVNLLIHCKLFLIGYRFYIIVGSKHAQCEVESSSGIPLWVFYNPLEELGYLRD